MSRTRSSGYRMNCWGSDPLRSWLGTDRMTCIIDRPCSVLAFDFDEFFPDGLTFAFLDLFECRDPIQSEQSLVPHLRPVGLLFRPGGHFFSPDHPTRYRYHASPLREAFIMKSLIISDPLGSRSCFPNEGLSISGTKSDSIGVKMSRNGLGWRGYLTPRPWQP